MPTIHIDNRSYDVPDGENLLAACLSRGLNLPYFCWHPAMGSVGACRQCAVKVFKDDKDQNGRLVMACMTPASDGTRASIDDEEARAFRASIIEWLMTNHPHDCPVCDEGGECHLQDMTVMTGHAYRRYRFTKRTYLNQYLGPFVHHEMNRCIECYRCVRFYRDYAGGRDFNVFASHNHVYFGRSSPGILENEFSGNLVEVCPTGVFTDHTFFHHYTRKWDLQNAPSICVHCSLGCNTTPGERYGMLRRIVNRYNSRINGYFLCDRGRYGYEFVNSDKRLRLPLIRVAGTESLDPADGATVLNVIRSRLSHGRAIGIGSPRASLESNFALRSLVGHDRFYQGVTEQEADLVEGVLRLFRQGAVPPASLHDVEQSDAVFIMGEDVLHSAPRLALAVVQAARRQPVASLGHLDIPVWTDGAIRQAVNERTGPLFVAGDRRTWLEDHATAALHAAPVDIARLGFAVAHELDPTAPPVADLNEEQRRLAQRIATDLIQAKQPAIVSGTGALSLSVIQAAWDVASALHKRGRPVKLAMVMPECNSAGVALLGGQPLEAAYDALDAGRADVAIVLENDLSRRATSRASRPDERAIAHDGMFWIVLDHLENKCARAADVVLPAATFAEGDGTLINHEGRAQRYYQVCIPSGDVQESWRWLRDIARSVGGDRPPRREAMMGWKGLDDVVRDLCRELPVFRSIEEMLPASSLRVAGRKIPRQPERYSGRTAMVANVTLHEPPPPVDPDSPFAFTMEGSHGTVPPPLQPQVWAPGWNSNQALNKFQEEVGGPLRDEMVGPLLIEPGKEGPLPAIAAIPPAFQPRPAEWLALPRYEIFGSEELSAAAAAVSTRIPAMSVAMHPDDAARMKWSVGDRLRLSLERQRIQLPLVVDESVPRGTVTVSRLWDAIALRLPGWCRLEKEGMP
ncbi:MAG TPA: NADH-quinone oxidoreductase subunit NuoG [Nitrospiraceae bacterium]|nr:NADH-quinone oxidoreductase subunit NuoG [Nitrospiraceae bacterium]